MKKVTAIIIVSLIVLLLLFSGCHKKRIGDKDKETTKKTELDNKEVECEDKAAPICYQYYCSNDECITERKSSCCGDGVCGMSETCDTCFQDCCDLNSELDSLSTYPDMIVGWDTVVGDKAPPEDVVVAADILTHVAMENLTVGKGKLASEIDLTLRNHIVVGHPCDNAAAAELWKREIVEHNGSCKVFENGDALVKLFPTSPTRVALYVGGYTPIDTERASKLLIDYDDFDMTGDFYKIKGSRSEPVPYMVS